MSNRTALIVPALLAVAFAPACSGEANEDLTGVATAAITNVPSDVGCIEIAVTGNRTVDRKYDVSPGASSVLSMSGLPVGSVTFVAQAFQGACSTITSTSVPTWLSDALSVTLVSAVNTDVKLALRRNGKASVSVDFDDSDDAGTTADSGTSTPDVGTSTTNKVVFVTSTVYDGNLGGLAGADAKCQARAAAAGLTGTFKAWISTAGPSPANRFTTTSGDYVLPNGIVIAHGWSGLTSGAPLLHAIDVTELKGAAPTVSTTSSCTTGSTSAAWTETDTSGLPQSAGMTIYDCSGWTSNAATGGIGSPTSVGADWTVELCSGSGAYAVRNCSDLAALYCFEQ